MIDFETKTFYDFDVASAKIELIKYIVSANNGSIINGVDIEYSFVRDYGDFSFNDGKFLILVQTFKGANVTSLLKLFGSLDTGKAIEGLVDESRGSWGTVRIFDGNGIGDHISPMAEKIAKVCDDIIAIIIS